METILIQSMREDKNMKKTDDFRVYEIDGVIYIHFPKRGGTKWNHSKSILKT